MTRPIMWPIFIDVTPHVTQNNGMAKTGRRRRSAIDARTTRHQGYGVSQTRRSGGTVAQPFHTFRAETFDPLGKPSSP
jgi:hypothetical protein